MNIARAWRFARHIPPQQILARGWIKAKRRLLPLFPLRGDPLAMPATLPAPVFPPRTGMMQQEGKGWRFTFLNHSIAMADDVDWRARGPSGLDQLWRMNLHYMEYLEEADLETGLALIKSWMSANDPPAPCHWDDAWNSYALSLRLVCWMQFFARHNHRPSPQMAASLSGQLRHLGRFPETDLGGNHLIKNIKALAWGSAFFEGSEAGRWGKMAWNLLAEELDRQVLSDGVHYERSPSYHNQVLADLIETRRALGGSPALDDAIARMAQAATLLTHLDGRTAQFNDAGLNMAYPTKVLIAAGSSLSKERNGPFVLKDSGFCGFHAPDFSLIAKMGRIGPDDLPAHAHGDIGSFELSVAGQRMIIDQGVFEYVEGESRRLSRATAQHNCLSLDGKDQAEFFGAFRCGARPDVTYGPWVATADQLDVTTSHTGFSALHGTPVVECRFLVSGRSVRIEDTISAASGARASIGLLLHPDCTMAVEGSITVVKRGAAALRIVTPFPLESEAAVWWPDMGVEIPTTRLRLTLPRDCLACAIDIAIGTPDHPEAF